MFLSPLRAWRLSSTQPGLRGSLPFDVQWRHRCVAGEGRARGRGRGRESCDVTSLRAWQLLPSAQPRSRASLPLDVRVTVAQQRASDEPEEEEEEDGPTKVPSYSAFYRTTASSLRSRRATEPKDKMESQRNNVIFSSPIFSERTIAISSGIFSRVFTK
ncbi:hypothetical protein PUN28_005666 [Cardiocondyla obscurior]|uniref:Uncharacterized protein n=1 Tax=Cardiocondyla obscurior TaxID=286306 RepID=A0AAW2G8H7_9HYME